MASGLRKEGRNENYSQISPADHLLLKRTSFPSSSSACQMFWAGKSLPLESRGPADSSAFRTPSVHMLSIGIYSPPAFQCLGKVLHKPSATRKISPSKCVGMTETDPLSMFSPLKYLSVHGTS